MSPDSGCQRRSLPGCFAWQVNPPDQVDNYSALAELSTSLTK